MARVISDAGPLIALAKADSLFVPRDLFSRIRIPEAVWLECVQKTGTDSRRIEQAASEGWLNVVSVATKRSHVAISYDSIMSHAIPEVTHVLSDSDCILYAGRVDG